MKPFALISIILVLISSGCSAIMESGDLDSGMIATGLVTDNEGNPIEHIKVSIMSEGMTPEVIYTSSDGIYKTFLSLRQTSDKGIQLSYIVEDIDGNENGGIFQTLEDKVIIFKENDNDWTSAISKDFRLSLSR